jgi:hypothetical protein
MNNYKGWRSLTKSKPEFNKLVEVKYEPIGVGSPEREGWQSTGRLRSDGTWTILQNPEKTVDFRKPTHWKEIDTNQ